MVGGGGLCECISSCTVCLDSKALRGKQGSGTLGLDCLSFGISSGTNKPIKR